MKTFSLRFRRQSVCTLMLALFANASLYASYAPPTDQGEEPRVGPFSSLFQGNSQDQLGGALAKLNAAIQANPNSAKLYEARAALSNLKQDFKAAIEDANRAAEIDPTDVVAKGFKRSEHYLSSPQ